MNKAPFILPALLVRVAFLPCGPPASDAINGESLLY